MDKNLVKVILRKLSKDEAHAWITEQKNMMMRDIKELSDYVEKECTNVVYVS